MAAATPLPFLLATAAMLVCVTCYPRGAPAKDCWTERPLHGDNMPAWGPSPFEIQLTKMDNKYDENHYGPGEYIRVSIRSRDGVTPFKGYLMKVYSSNGVSGGRWGARKGVSHVLKKCGVTHNNNITTTSVDIMWKAPRTPIMDTIQFKAIVVKDYKTFYNNILSKPLKPEYPPNYIDELFTRLRAYARMTFNVTLPTLDALAPPVPVPTSDVPATDPKPADATAPNDNKPSPQTSNTNPLELPAPAAPASPVLPTLDLPKPAPASVVLPNLDLLPKPVPASGIPNLDLTQPILGSLVNPGLPLPQGDVPLII